ncbi:MAG: DNA-binding protein Alba [Candidatus Bathyarchaeota archaeon]|nr:DNA-binding protein Alba [Candidatus Bathyarchaeota archaeon]
MERSNTVFIGRKPVLNYVLACMTLFKSGHEEISVKARGRSISRAVDVVEVLKNRFMPNAQIVNIQISTEQMQSEERGTSNVSTIDITVKA